MKCKSAEEWREKKYRLFVVVIVFCVKISLYADDATLSVIDPPPAADLLPAKTKPTMISTPGIQHHNMKALAAVCLTVLTSRHCDQKTPPTTPVFVCLSVPPDFRDVVSVETNVSDKGAA